jgi:glycosyltransferase involved in cell wall biosynthesis
MSTEVKPENTVVAPSSKVKILIVSTHINQVNGYSKVAYNLIQQLATQPWIDIVHFGTQRMLTGDLGRVYPSSVKVIDGTAMEKEKQPGFALGELPNVIKAEKPHIVLIYNDLSVICAYLEHIRKSIENRFFKVWAYVDVTYAGIPPGMMDFLNRDVERVFTFTKSWRQVLKSQGITRPVEVIPHGVDPKQFRTIPRDLARQTLGLPKDMFLITSVNKNIPRKRLDLLVMSFVALIVRFPMKPIFMLIVADKGDRGGFPLFEIYARELKMRGADINHYGNRRIITSKDTCYRDDDINMLYNVGDIGVSCADGEGFGLCSFEQMSVGVPQVVPEINGYTEYCNANNSLLVKPTHRYYIPQGFNSVTGEAQMVNPEDVANAIQRYVTEEDLRGVHGKAAKETALSYTWEKAAAVLIKRLRAVQEEEE